MRVQSVANKVVFYDIDQLEGQVAQLEQAVGWLDEYSQHILARAQRAVSSGGDHVHGHGGGGGDGGDRRRGNGGSSGAGAGAGTGASAGAGAGGASPPFFPAAMRT